MGIRVWVKILTLSRLSRVFCFQGRSWQQIRLLYIYIYIFYIIYYCCCGKKPSSASRLRETLIFIKILRLACARAQCADLCPSKVGVSCARDASFHFLDFSDFRKFAFRLRETRPCRILGRQQQQQQKSFLSVSPTPNDNFRFWTPGFALLHFCSILQNLASRLRQMTTLVTTPS